LQIDTSNILFIVGGAFDGLEKIVSKRLGENTIGFKTDMSGKKDIKKEELFKFVEPKDLVKYGLIPEFIGRLPIKTSVNQFQKMFELDNIDLVFTDEALDAMADLALERKTGARGLRSILEKILLDEMFEAPSRKDITKIIIDEENVKNDIPPKMVLKESKDDKTA